MRSYRVPGSRLLRGASCLLGFLLFQFVPLEKDRPCEPAFLRDADAAAKKKPIRRWHKPTPQVRRGGGRSSHASVKLPLLRDGRGQPTELGPAQGGGAAPAASPPTLAAKPAPAAPTPLPPQTASQQNAQRPGKAARIKKGAPTDAELLEDAQGAYVRGEKQKAIDLALGVAQKDVPESEAAWRFIGLVACSVRSQRLATRAYQHLHSPSDQRTITGACSVNGLSYKGDQFVGE
jgi:hypothetical protein